MLEEDKKISNKKELLEYVRKETNLTNLLLATEIFDNLNNKNNIFEIIKILEKDTEEIAFNVTKNKENIKLFSALLGDPLNKSDIDKIYDKIIYFVEKKPLYSFTILTPNGINIPISKTNHNYFNDLESIYSMLEENSRSYDLNLNPVILIGTQKLNMTINNKENHKIFANVLKPNSVMKLNELQIKGFINPEIFEDINYIYEES